MPNAATSDISYDPYDVDINRDPYPAFKRLRDEAPLYRNEQHDFWALSRFADVEAGLKDQAAFTSGRGAILELIQNPIELPPGIIVFEDPPIHTVHRRLLSRVFTPKKMNALEPQVRDFCARSLDPLVGEGGFDFVKDLGSQMPMRVIGMLLGIPEADQEAVRDRTDRGLQTEPGQKMEMTADALSGEAFAEYIDWRAEHPSDDLMTEMLTAEFEDETGTVRRLTREEVLTYITVIAGAGNETTTRLIGWTGKVLGEHPDARRELAADRSLVPNAIEELLRFEPPAPHVGRYVPEDVELYDQVVPAGSAMLLLTGAGNRDERRFEDPDRFDIHRNVGQHVTFGYGIHFCLGAALARLEGRIALDEVLQRFPDWEPDLDRAVMSSTSTVRGWETMPVTVS
jgi:cytochrome P450